MRPNSIERPSRCTSERSNFAKTMRESIEKTQKQQAQAMILDSISLLKILVQESSQIIVSLIKKYWKLLYKICNRKRALIKRVLRTSTNNRTHPLLQIANSNHLLIMHTYILLIFSSSLRHSASSPL